MPKLQLDQLQPKVRRDGETKIPKLSATKETEKRIKPRTAKGIESVSTKQPTSQSSTRSRGEPVLISTMISEAKSTSPGRRGGLTPAFGWGTSAANKAGTKNGATGSGSQFFFNNGSPPNSGRDTSDLSLTGTLETQTLLSEIAKGHANAEKKMQEGKVKRKGQQQIRHKSPPELGRNQLLSPLTSSPTFRVTKSPKGKAPEFAAKKGTPKATIGRERVALQQESK